MNYGEIKEALAAQEGLSTSKADSVLKTTVKIIQEALIKDGEAKVVGLGTFVKKARAARTGRNPKTNEPIEIPASVTVSLRAGKTLKDKLNGITEDK